MWGDFNGDGKSDVLWRNIVSGEVVIWLMNGTTAIGTNTLLADLNWIPTHIGDFLDETGLLKWRRRCPSKY